MSKKKGKCARCSNYFRGLELRRRNRFPVFGIRMRSDHGAYLVDMAEHLLKLVPRKPIVVTARSIDQYRRYQPYAVTKKHLPHIDPTKPGIMGQIAAFKHPFKFILEGHHRMERNRLERTDWSCYLLTPYETWLLSAPICDCWKGVQV